MTGSKLFELCTECRWTEVLETITKHPEQAEALIDTGKRGAAKISILQIMLAHPKCKGDVPLEVVETVLRLAPETARTKHLYTGNLPLHAVFYNAFFSSAKRRILSEMILREFPGSVETRNFDGRTPLHTNCTQHCNYEPILQLIRAAPHTASWRDRNGEIPLHLACRSHKPPNKSIRALYEAYPEGIFMKNADGQTPLEVARACPIREPRRVARIALLEGFERCQHQKQQENSSSQSHLQPQSVQSSQKRKWEESNSSSIQQNNSNNPNNPNNISSGENGRDITHHKRSRTSYFPRQNHHQQHQNQGSPPLHSSLTLSSSPLPCPPPVPIIGQPYEHPSAIARNSQVGPPPLIQRNLQHPMQHSSLLRHSHPQQQSSQTSPPPLPIKNTTHSSMHHPPRYTQCSPQLIPSRLRYPVYTRHLPLQSQHLHSTPQKPVVVIMPSSSSTESSWKPRYELYGSGVVTPSMARHTSPEKLVYAPQQVAAEQTCAMALIAMSTKG